jgi:hypothetical protein
MSLCTKPVNVVKARNIGHAVVDDVVNVVLSSIVDGELPVSGVLTSKSSHISSKDTGNLKPAEVKRRQEIFDKFTRLTQFANQSHLVTVNMLVQFDNLDQQRAVNQELVSMY